MKQFRHLRLALVLVALGGCTALGNLQNASRPLDVYELRALPSTRAVATGGRHLVVEPPVTSGALATERIAVKPNALEVSYLPDARWVDAAPEHVQRLVAQSLAGTGRYSLVSTDRARPDPDWFLSLDLEAFQLELGAGAEPRVTVALRATVVSDIDRRVRGARSFSQSVPVAGTGTAEVIPAFDRATLTLLQELVNWTVSVAP